MLTLVKQGKFTSTSDLQDPNAELPKLVSDIGISILIKPVLKKELLPIELNLTILLRANLTLVNPVHDAKALL